jgi:hypothetical protein
MLSIGFILIFLLIIWFYLSSGNQNSKKNYTALFINSKEMVEMKIPMNKQKQISSDNYSIPIQTETLYSSVETNQDFYQSILTRSDVPYFPVRETIFQKDLRLKSRMIIDPKKGNYSNKNAISDV